MTIRVQTVEEVAASQVARGFSPEHVGHMYRLNAEAMHERANRIRRKGEGAKVAGYTLAMCIESAERAEHRAVAVPNAMRALAR